MPPLVCLLDRRHPGYFLSVRSNRLDTENAVERCQIFIKCPSVADPSGLEFQLLGYLKNGKRFPRGEADIGEVRAVLVDHREKRGEVTARCVGGSGIPKR